MEGSVYPEEVSYSESKQYEERVQGIRLITLLTISQYIPNMIRWYKAGRFPVDKLVKFYSAKDFPKALKDMEEGVAIKPVLIW